MKNVPEILSKKQQRNELETRIRLLFLLKKFLKNVEERIKQCGSLCEKDIPLLVWDTDDLRECVLYLNEFDKLLIAQRLFKWYNKLFNSAFNIFLCDLEFKYGCDPQYREAMVKKMGFYPKPESTETKHREKQAYQCYKVLTGIHILGNYLKHIIQDLEQGYAMQTVCWDGPNLLPSRTSEAILEGITRLNHTLKIFTELVTLEDNPQIDAGKIEALSKPAQLAWQEYQQAVNEMPDFNSRKTNDKTVWEWLLLHSQRKEDMPDVNTWQRHLRTARKYHGLQKNKPRAGRETWKNGIQEKDN